MPERLCRASRSHVDTLANRITGFPPAKRASAAQRRVRRKHAGMTAQREIVNQPGTRSDMKTRPSTPTPLRCGGHGALRSAQGASYLLEYSAGAKKTRIVS